MRFVGNQPDVAVIEAWEDWHRDHTAITAPVLLRYEVVNALYNAYRFGGVPRPDVENALRVADSLPIAYEQTPGDHRRALEIALRYTLRGAYDAHYLALAERLGVEFWTADRRLFNAVHRDLPWVRLVGADADDAGS